MTFVMNVRNIWLHIHTLTSTIMTADRFIWIQQIITIQTRTASSNIHRFDVQFVFAYTVMQQMNQLTHNVVMPTKAKLLMVLMVVHIRIDFMEHTVARHFFQCYKKIASMGFELMRVEYVNTFRIVRVGQHFPNMKTLFPPYHTIWETLCPLTQSSFHLHLIRRLLKRPSKFAVEEIIQWQAIRSE